MVRHLTELICVKLQAWIGGFRPILEPTPTMTRFRGDGLTYGLQRATGRRLGPSAEPQFDRAQTPGLPLSDDAAVQCMTEAVLRAPVIFAVLARIDHGQPGAPVATFFGPGEILLGRVALAMPPGQPAPEFRKAAVAQGLQAWPAQTSAVVHGKLLQ